MAITMPKSAKVAAQKKIEVKTAEPFGRSCGQSNAGRAYSYRWLAPPQQEGSLMDGASEQRTAFIGFSSGVPDPTVRWAQGPSLAD
jgi:hypothetical protein